MNVVAALGHDRMKAVRVERLRMEISAGHPTLPLSMISEVAGPVCRALAYGTILRDVARRQ